MWGDEFEALYAAARRAHDHMRAPGPPPRCRDSRACPSITSHFLWARRYTKYEAEGRGRETVKAQKLWFHVLESQVETGTPYILFKDACNRKSNQQHLGTIKSSNLCTEIVEYTSPDEVAVCNLASVSLPAFVNEATRTFDFERLVAVTKVATKNLNKVIDVNVSARARGGPCSPTTPAGTV